MGLTVHYRGRIRDYALLDELIEEVEVFAKGKKWKYMIFRPGINSPLHYADPEDPEPLPEVKGIAISPENCEPICFTFLQDGRLCAPFHPPIEIDGLPHVFTKTAYAGADVHIHLIELLQLMNGKYFSVLKVDDESGYWESGDVEDVLIHFGHYNLTLDDMEDAIKIMKENVEKGGDPPDFNIDAIYLDGPKTSA